jgi:hypothetical protein
MYEKTGRYYAFFGPHASVTAEEEGFFAHWAAGRRRALDLGAGLCGPAMMLARHGLEVLAFEPSSALAALAMDRLNRGDDMARSVTLVEGPVAALAEPFRADLILIRSVLMLLDDDARAEVLAAAARHAAPGAALVLDARTSALTWAEKGDQTEERALGSTVYRRVTCYAREEDGSTRVDWSVFSTLFGTTRTLGNESFRVRADSVEDLGKLIGSHGFAIEEVYGSYDLGRRYQPGDPMIVVAALRL